MQKMRALVANDPRVYREVIAEALKELRPLIEVSATEPEELEREVARRRPHLIICSRISAAALAGCLAWVMLYPDGEDRAEIGGVVGGGGRTVLPSGVGVSDLLSVVDETELRYRSSHGDYRDEVVGSVKTTPVDRGLGRTGGRLPRRTS